MMLDVIGGRDAEPRHNARREVAEEGCVYQQIIERDDAHGDEKGAAVGS